jgi:TonB family protein
MRHPRRYIAIALLLLSASPTLARQYSGAEIKAMFTYMPWPDYPYHARSIHMTGVGMFRLLVNEEGRVTSVVTLQSTGERELDAEAIKTYMRWQARPGPKREVGVPTKFTLR